MASPKVQFSLKTELWPSKAAALSAPQERCCAAGLNAQPPPAGTSPRAKGGHVIRTLQKQLVTPALQAKHIKNNDQTSAAFRPRRVWPQLPPTKHLYLYLSIYLMATQRLNCTCMRGAWQRLENPVHRLLQACSGYFFAVYLLLFLFFPPPIEIEGTLETCFRWYCLWETEVKPACWKFIKSQMGTIHLTTTPN